MAQVVERTFGYRWVILGVLWTTYLVVFLNRLSVGPLGPFLKDELAITSAQVGLIMSAASLGYMVTLFPAGLIIDRVGSRWTIAIAEFIAGACMLVIFSAPSYASLLILMFTTGLACGFLMPSTSQGVINWFPARERATAMGFKQTAVNAGGIVSAITLPAVALAIGWRYGFLILGIAAITIGLVALVLYREHPGENHVQATIPKDTEKLSVLEILKMREIWLLASAGLCISWVEMATMGHLVLYLKEALLVPVVAAGALLASAEAAGALARPGGGFISDRIFGGRRRLVFMLMAVTASVACLVIGLFGPVLSWGIFPVIFLLGLAGIGFGGVYFTLLAEFGGRRRAASAVGLGNTISMAGSTLGPVVFGYIVDTTGSYKPAWLSLAGIAALCLLLLLFVSEKNRRI